MSWRRAAAALLLAALLAQEVAVVTAGVVAVGELQSCVQDGATAELPLACQKKIVVTVSVDNNRLFETEQLSFGVSCVNSPTGACPCPCDYAADAGCACRDLRETLLVAATKTPVYASYPLTYRQNFNGRPYEEVIKGTVASRWGSACSDGELDEFPTCGWATDAAFPDGIPYSQGFCCTCDALSASDLTRGGLKCGGLWGIGDEQSAHCLRLSDDWWHAGFLIGEFSLDFAISLNVTVVRQPASGANITTPRSSGNSTSGATTATQVLSITPARPLQLDASRRVSARLLGDMASYQQEAQLDGKWLLVPFQIGQGRQQYLSARRHEWLVVDTSMVSPSGTECNKIGTSYDAFRNRQPNACTSFRGSCLGGQIADLYYADVAGIQQGRTPQYLIGRYGGSTPDVSQPDQVRFSAGGAGSAPRLSLNLPITSIKTSLLALSVAADDVAFVVNRSPAAIDGVEVCTFDGMLCGGFEALASRGYLHVDVRNTGYAPADFAVSVDQCTPGVLSVQAQLAGIAQQASRRFTFELRMETDQATNSSCTVSVADALGGMAAERSVSFFTNATAYEEPPTQSDIEDKLVPPAGGPNADWCKAACPSLFDFKCSLTKGCWGRLTQGAAAIVGPLAWAALTFYLWKQGYLSLILRCCGAICCGSSAAAAPLRRPPADDDTPMRQRSWRRRGDRDDSPQPAAGAAAAGADGDVRLVMSRATSLGGKKEAAEPEAELPPADASSSTPGAAVSWSGATLAVMAAQQMQALLAALQQQQPAAAAAGSALSSPPTAAAAELQALVQLAAQPGWAAARSPQVSPTPSARSPGASPLAHLMASAVRSPSSPPPLLGSPPVTSPVAVAPVVPGASVAPSPGAPAPPGAAPQGGSGGGAQLPTLASLEQQLRRVQSQRQQVAELAAAAALPRSASLPTAGPPAGTEPPARRPHTGPGALAGGRSRLARGG